MPFSQKAIRLFKILRGKKERRNDFELKTVKAPRRRSQSDPPGGGVASLPRLPPQPPRVAERAVAIPAIARLGKRKRKTMGQNGILIHEDTDAQARPAHKLRKMESRRPVVQVPQEEDELQDFDGEETSSETSEETEEDVDESVAEDMRKLEESFKGISQKYRLINRIGEGKSQSNSLTS